MRMEREDVAASQGGAAIFHPPDCRIAIFDGKRKIASHERGAHSGEFTPEDASSKDKRFGPPADRAIEAFHADLASAWRTQDFLPKFDLSCAAIPKGRGSIGARAGSHFFNLGLELPVA